MAWLQNLAGKAEDFLNKIDQNASIVLNESSSSSQLTNLQPEEMENNTSEVPGDNINNTTPPISVEIINETKPNPEIEEQLENVLVESNETEIVITAPQEDSSSSAPDDDNYTISTVFENSMRTESATLSTASSSTQHEEQARSEEDVRSYTYTLSSNPSCSTQPEEPSTSEEGARSYSYTLASRPLSDIPIEVQMRFEDEISKFEVQNKSLNQEILNLQHEFSQLKNNYGNLQVETGRARESSRQAELEMEQYKARTQRILQEKEKLILLGQQSSGDTETDRQNKILTTYNEQLRKDMQFQQDRNNELTKKVENLNKELTALQQQYVNEQNATRSEMETLQETLKTEKKIRVNSEEEIRAVIRDLQRIEEQSLMLQKVIKEKDIEIETLKSQLRKQARRSNADLESRLHTLTQTLMAKQTTLETTTSERNALRIQLENIEASYTQLLNQRQRPSVNVNNGHDSDDARSQVPRFMQASPLDAEMTRRVKRVYSTLDTVSIRTGRFLRRYPGARVFIFCYMIMIHIWVLYLLFGYAPASR